MPSLTNMTMKLDSSTEATKLRSFTLRHLSTGQADTKAVISRFVILFLLLFCGFLATPGVHADIYINGADSGGNVVISFSGSLEDSTIDAHSNVSQRNSDGNFGGNPKISGGVSTSYFNFVGTSGGGFGFYDDLTALNPTFQQPLPVNLDLSADSRTGDVFIIDTDVVDNDIALPTNYVGGTEISGSMTFNGTSLAALGIDVNSPQTLVLVGPLGEAIRYWQQPSAADFEALSSFFNSALPMNGAARQIAPGVQQIGVNGLGNRLFRVRGRVNGNGGITQNGSRGSRFENVGREVAASRMERLEGRLTGDTTINLNGRSSQNSANTEETASEAPVLRDDNPFFTETRQAGASHGPGTVTGGENWELFVSTDFGNSQVDELAATPGIESNTQSTTVGFEYRLNDNLNLGAGWSHVWNDNTMTNNLGGVDIEGDTGMVYATYFRDNFWADLLYSYGSYDADIRRNTGLGTSVLGASDVTTHLTQLNLGYNIPCGKTLVHGPTLGIEYTDGQLDGYTETGDPRANTRFGEQDFESLITRLGWQASWSHETTLGLMTPQVRIGYGRENIDQNQNVSGTLINSPFGPGVGGFTATQNQTSPGEGWMDLGAGVGIQVCENVSLLVDYQTQLFREFMTVHYGSVRAQIKF